MPRAELALGEVEELAAPRVNTLALGRHRVVQRKEADVVARVVRVQLGGAARSGARVEHQLRELRRRQLLRPRPVGEEPARAAATAVRVGAVDELGEAAQAHGRVDLRRVEAREVVQLGALDAALLCRERRLARHAAPPLGGQRHRLEHPPLRSRVGAER
eukprot:5953632-Prymnesium_polylepis.1